MATAGQPQGLPLQKLTKTTTMKGSKRHEAEPCEDYYRYHCYCCGV